jgi:coenzyme F420-0:L-glutamate ligase/coenzyme F420-1:gamma-L-glutamate ligase
VDLRAFALRGIPELVEGDDLAALIVEAAARAGRGLEDGDVVVVAQKAVSKVEGRVVPLAEIEASPRAIEIATSGEQQEDPRRIQAILDETAEIVRVRPPLVISETRHGFVCASAGVDASNTGGQERVVLLPVAPDASAQALRDRLRELTGRTVGVIVTDSFGRAWRTGTTDVAIGCAGIRPLVDWHGHTDSDGYVLHATTIAVADEIAGAAELVRGKLDATPVAVVRGLDVAGDGSAQELVMPRERDLFR